MRHRALGGEVTEWASLFLLGLLGQVVLRELESL